MRAHPTNFCVVPRLCERPGCSAAANVTYGFDTTDRAVWLSPFEGDGQERPYGSGILCRRHADALAVPRGWRVDDRREAVPRLFLAPKARQADSETADIAKPVRQRASRDRRAPAADLFNVVEQPDDEPVLEETVLEETKAIPWSPQLLDDIADDNLTDRDIANEAPRGGGLLSRAFGNKDRRDKV